MTQRTRNSRNSRRIGWQIGWLRGIAALLLALSLVLSACTHTSNSPIKPHLLPPLHLPGVTRLTAVSDYLLHLQLQDNALGVFTRMFVATPSWSSQPLLMIPDYHNSNDPTQEGFQDVYTMRLDGSDARRISLDDTCDDLALAYQQRYLLCDSVTASALEALSFVPPGRPAATSITLLDASSNPPYTGGDLWNWSQARAEAASIQNPCSLALFASPSATTPTSLHLVATLNLDPLMAQLKLGGCFVMRATWSSDGHYLILSSFLPLTPVEAIDVSKLLEDQPSGAETTPPSIPVSTTQTQQVAKYGAAPFTQIAVAPAAPVIAYVGEDLHELTNTLWLYNLRTGKDQRVLEIPSEIGSLYETICQLTWGPEGRSLIFGVCGYPYAYASTCTGDCLPPAKIWEDTYTLALPASLTA